MSSFVQIHLVHKKVHPSGNFVKNYFSVLTFVSIFYGGQVIAQHFLNNSNGICYIAQLCNV